MDWRLLLYTLPLFLAAALALSILLYALHHRFSPGARAFAGLMLAVVLWTSLYALELSSSSMSAQVFLRNLSFIGAFSLPALFVIFVLRFIRPEQKISPLWLALLWIEVILALILAWTNDWHHLFFQDIRQVYFPPIYHLVTINGPAYWLQIIIEFALMVFGTILLIHELVRKSPGYQPRIIIVSLGILTPVLAGIISYFGSSSIPLLNLTPYSFLIAELTILWGIVYFNFLETTKLAQQAVIERMKSPLLVINLENRIIYTNSAASDLFDMLIRDMIGKPVERIWPAWQKNNHTAELAGSDRQQLEMTIQRRTAKGYGEKWFRPEVSDLHDKAGLTQGRLIIWQDVTINHISPEAYRFGQERLIQFVNNSPNPIFAVDIQGIVRAWNPACETSFFFGKEILGQGFQQILAEHELPALEEKLAQVFKDCRTFSDLDIEYQRKDGSFRYMATRLYPLLDHQGNTELCIIANTDITSRMQDQQTLRREFEELRVLHAVASACAVATDEDSLIDQVTDIIGSTVFPDNFGVIFIDEDLRIFFNHRSYREQMEGTPSSMPLESGICGRVVREGLPVRVGDISQEPAYYEIDPLTRSELCVPLKTSDRIIGVVNAESQQLNAFDENDERLLTILAGQLAGAIERLRIETTERQRVQELQAITRISREVTSLLDLTSVLNSIVRYAAEISNSDASGLFLYQPDGRLKLFAAYGVSEAFIQAINKEGITQDGSAVGRAIQLRRPYQIPFIPDEPSYKMKFFAEMEGIQAILALPMQRGEEPIGGIVIWNHQPHKFTPEEEQFIHALANHSVNAVENARIFEAERAQRKLADVLRETGTVLSTLLDFDELLDNMLIQLERLVPYDAANVMLLEGNSFRVARARGYEKFGEEFSQIVHKLRLEIDSTRNLKHLLETGQPFVISDITKYPDWIWLTPDYPTRSWLGAPVIVQCRVMALFSLDKAEPGFYQPEHAERLAIYSGQAGLALQNAQLFNETKRRAHHQEVLNNIIDTAVHAPNLGALVETVLDLIMDALEIRQAGLWVSGFTALRDIPAGLVESEVRIGQDQGGGFQTTVDVSDWLEIEPDDPDFHWAKLITAYNIRASLSIPIFTGGRRVGGLALACSEPRTWLQDEIDLVEAVCQQISSAAERLELTGKTQEQARQMQSIIDTVPDGVLLLDAQQRIVLANPAARNHLSSLLEVVDFSQPLNCLGDQTIQDLFSWDEETGWRELQTHHDPQLIFEVAVRPLEVMTFNAGWVLVLRDITEERLSMARTQMQDRLATVGQLAAGIAHDFNNIMAAIVVYSDLLAIDPELSPNNREQIHIIQQQIQRATSLIRQILDFSRRSVMEPNPLDLLPFIKELDRLLERTLPENILLRLSYQPGVYRIKADPTRLQQVFMNLALNARDAMPLGGILQFALSRLNLREESRLPLPELTPGTWIQLSISDTGAGIPENILPHIFDPFYTTKAAGKGTGLGLAQVYGIVKQHGGSIDVRSQIGEGTTFNLYFPELSTPEERMLPSDTQSGLNGQGETILVVEDDPATRQALQSLLESRNYQVFTAEDGVEALRFYDPNDPIYQSDIELVISDIVMPGMGGLTLYYALHERNQGIKILFITGHPLDLESQDLLEESRIEWLQKPFSVQDFLTIVQRILIRAGRST